MSIRFIHVVPFVRIFFVFKPKSFSLVRRYQVLFVHSSVVGYLDCFYLLVIANNTAMNTDVQIFFKTLLSIPRSGIAGPYGNYF